MHLRNIPNAMKLTSYIYNKIPSAAKALIHAPVYTEKGEVRCGLKNQTHDWTILKDSLSYKEKKCEKCGTKRTRTYHHPAV